MSVSSKGEQQRSRPVRSVQMLDKLRRGLEEYVRLYNPITTNWRELKLRANRGKDRIRIVGIDDDEETLYSDSGDEQGFRTNASSSLSIENDNLLAPVFTRRAASQLKRAGSLENLSSSFGKETPSLPPLSDRGWKKSRGSVPGRALNNGDLYEERKENIRTTLRQMGTLKNNLKSHAKFKASDKERARRLSAQRKLNLSVITESPQKLDMIKSTQTSPTKEIHDEVQYFIVDIFIFYILNSGLNYET